MIVVERSPGSGRHSFTVAIGDANGQTRHEVSLSQSEFKRLTNGSVTPELCVWAAFAFLLHHEPKEAILPKFDIIDIAKYFPTFKDEISTYLELAKHC